MEKQETHRKTSDARRLIKYQKKGHKLSTQETELIEKYRDKERIRQQRFRKTRKLAFPPRKRGRKPSTKSQKTVATIDSVHLPGKIEGCYQEDLSHQSVASSVDMLINGYRGICFVPIDSRILAAHVNNPLTVNSQRHHEEDWSRTSGLSTLPESVRSDVAMPVLPWFTYGQLNVSSPCIYPATPTSLSVPGVDSLACSGTSPTPSCTSSSSIGTSPFLTVSSLQSPESSAFISPVGMSEECQVGLNEHASTSATSAYVPNLIMGFLPDGERNNSTTPPRNYGAITEPPPRSALQGVLSHSLQASPTLHRRVLLPRHVRQLRGLFQSWSAADKDHAFAEMIAFVKRVVEEVVDEVSLRSTSSSTTINNDDEGPYAADQILESQANGEIHDIWYEFTNSELKC
ncbi:hypothetical protein V1517DRAFT_295950 [Lipomyces orientalis]|uniref:Uncharacterized protein n=1 Tax=Lipomyces orientalis TaxID=1233043 RepID=A0ACC3TG91_9ASCO